MFLCSLRYCLKLYFSKGVYSFTLSTVCVYDEENVTPMKWSKAHEVTLRAVLEMLFMYLCPHLVRRQTLISPEASRALLYE